MCVTSNRFYAIIGTSCLSYIFSILSFCVLYFISVSETPDAQSSPCILVLFLMHFNMSADDVEETAALSSSGTAEVETHHQTRGRDWLRLSSHPLFETQEPRFVESRSSQLKRNLWFYPEFRSMQVCLSMFFIIATLKMFLCFTFGSCAFVFFIAFSCFQPFFKMC